MRYTHVMITLALVLVFGVAPAFAIIQFQQQFEKLYLKDHPDKKYVEAVKKASDKCFVCHQGKKSKKNHNAFGVHLVELLDRKKDMKDNEKIKVSLEKVMAMHVDPKDPKSETYLDRVKASKWPGGELEELKKEPADAGKADAGK